MKHVSPSEFRRILLSAGPDGGIAEFGRGLRILILAVGALWLTSLAFLFPVHLGEEGPSAEVLAKAPHPLIGKYCMECHDSSEKAGGVAFDQMSLAQVDRNGETWEAAVRRLSAGMMPPVGAPRPTAAENAELVKAITTRLDDARPVPAPTVLRRMTRTEYGNVIRDLLGMQVDTAGLLPPDPAVRGFDNIGEVLTTSPALIQGYLNAGMKIARLAVGDTSIAPSRQVLTAPHNLDNQLYVEGLPLGTRGGIRSNVQFPVEGDYVIEVRKGAGTTLYNAFGGGPMPDVALTIANRSFKVDQQGKAYVHVKAGTFPITAALRNGDIGPGVNDIYATYNIRGAIIEVAIQGPFNARPAGHTATRAKIFSCYPRQQWEERTCARTIVSQLATRAFRHPVSLQSRELDYLMRYYDQGRQNGGFENGVQRALASILVDPRFLYKFESEPAAAAPGTTYAVSPVELASRLSFFLWSSIPDDQLMQSAVSGKLGQPDELNRQVRRMIADPKADALAGNFARQWFRLQQLATAERESKDFDDNLRFAMERETTLLFAHVLRDNRPLSELLNADYTFLNQRLARHYGIKGVEGDYFRMVKLPSDSPRRGLLGQASILTVTAVANRTSPVIRGAWVLDNILGVPPSPPPPGVEVNLDATAAPSTLRERLAIHRQSKTCATCHNMMDPIGLSLENFDQVGKWRTMDGQFPIDATGTLVDGSNVNGIGDLRGALLRHEGSFTSNAVSKLMTYALGRPVTYREMPAVRDVIRRSASQDERMIAIIQAIVTSKPFLTRTKPWGPPLAAPMQTTDRRDTRAISKDAA